MCGRFVLDKTYKSFLQLYQLDNVSTSGINIDPNYNVTPSTKVPIIISDPIDHSFKVVNMNWGYIPQWSRKSEFINQIINARIETISQKHIFKEPYATRRCLIPVTGFYEWDKKASPRQPYFIHYKTNKLFSLGGLQISNKDTESEETSHNFVIITVPANENIGIIHDRMPLIINPKFNKIWLESSPLSAKIEKEIIFGNDTENLQLSKVSTLVNNPRNNFPDLLKLND